jgi:beta-glucosidase
MKGRTYRFMADEPLFPFGFGLSYTTFAYGKIALSRASIPPDGRILITAVVKNTGKRAGHEVVQCYMRDVAASVPVPLRKLVGFKRVRLLPGKSQAVRFAIGPEQLACYADDGTPRVESGDFEITIGGGQPGPGCVAARFAVMERVR